MALASYDISNKRLFIDWLCYLNICILFVVCREQNEDDLVDYYTKKYADSTNIEHAGEEVESDEIRQQALMPTQK